MDSNARAGSAHEFDRAIARSVMAGALPLAVDVGFPGGSALQRCQHDGIPNFNVSLPHTIGRLPLIP